MAEQIMRKNKTRQDAMPIEHRDRVMNAQRVRDFSQKHKPTCTKDWVGLRQTTT